MKGTTAAEFPCGEGAEPHGVATRGPLVRMLCPLAIPTGVLAGPIPWPIPKSLWGFLSPPPRAQTSRIAPCGLLTASRLHAVSC